MAQTYKYTIVGDTQPAVKGNEALDASINKVDASTKQLDASAQKFGVDSQKAGLDAQKAFGQELETKIKATDARIKTISGTVGLFTGTISTAVGALGLFGIDDEQIAGFQKATLSVLALGSGAAQAITGFKDLTEARKLQNEVTIASTTAENANTAALTAQAAAAGGVTVALGNAATSITSETIATEANTLSKAANIASDEALFAERVRLSAQGIVRTEAEIAQTFATEANTVATTGLTVATGQLTIAQRALNIVAKANPYIAIASILFAVGTAVFALTSATKSNTDAEKDNADARKKNEDAMRKEEDASLRLARARGASTVALAEETLKLAKNRKERAEAEFVAAQLENKFSERTVAAREAVKDATLDLEVAEAELENTREEARKKAGEDAKTAADKAKELRDQKLEAEGLRQVIKQLGDEVINSIIFAPANPGSLLDVRNLQDIDTTLKSVFKSLEEIDLLELEDPIKFLSEEQLTILKRLRGELNTELQQQLFAREQQYKDELALFADNEDAKTRLTEEYEKDRVKIRRQFALQVARDTIGVTSDFLNTIAQINQASLELQLLQAAGNQAAIDKINADALEKQKKLRIAQVIVTTAESILNGFNATSTLPPPFNFIAGTALAAAYTALGAKTIQTISATTLEGSGANTGFNNIPGGVGTGFSLGGTPANLPTTGALPGLGGGRIATTPTVGTIGQEPVRAYVLAGDVTNGVQANIALNNRRRLAG